MNDLFNSDQYCEVAVDFPIGKGILTYAQTENVNPGDLIHVPLGRRKAKGCVLKTNLSFNELTDDVKKFDLKAIGEIIPASIQLSEKEILLFQWMANFYHYSMGQLVFDCLPKFLKRPRAFEFEQGQNLEIPFEYSVEQKVVLERMEKLPTFGFRKEYVQGVTGSGKTAVYLSRIKKTIDEEKSVLFLLPEINLTPQFVKTFSEYLNCKVLSYHSGVNASQKFHIWKTLKESSEPIFVMGVRSSVFLPIDNLGLVIVDEEHDSSFKQSDRCPYNGRDVAIKKAQLSNCPIILGSATPSLENYYEFNLHPENYYRMDNRISGAFPEIELIDAKELDPKTSPSWPISPEAISLMNQAFDRGEQVIVFVSRLGYANFIQCSGCGHKFTDPETDTNLRYFKKKNILRSAHSEYQIPVPDICPECGNMNLLQLGYGTEKVQEVLSQIFPNKKIGRFDRDEIKNFEDLSFTLNQFEAGNLDVLVGTQMLSKGHNFKKVNLVIVLGIDHQLNFPDFRSIERAYQLLVQVSGRAGRYSKQSTVAIQTMQPESGFFETFKQNNIDLFFKNELMIREMTSFPPFKKTAAIFFSARNRDDVATSSQQAKNFLHKVAKENNLDVEVMGPAPVTIEKRANQFTWNIVCRSSQYQDLYLVLKKFNEVVPIQKNVSFKIDVNPYFYC